jgi:uncharacterized repeat protein (TIGR01451 family)
MSQASGRWLPRFSNPLRGTVRPRRARRRSRPELETLESRTVLSVTIAASNNGGSGYAGLNFSQSGGYTPPDTCGAAGPTSYVETVNQTVAIYSPKATGAKATTSSLSNFWFTTGGLAHADGGSSLSDPIVVYDDQIGRFIVGDQDVDFNTHVSRFDFAVSNTSSPATLTTADWNFYQYNTTESGFDADYPGNFGYNHDAFVFTLNMFGVTGGGHAQVVSISNSDLASGVPQSSLHAYSNDLNDFSVRPTTMHDSVAGDPMWLVTEHGDNQSIDVIKMGSVLSTGATFAYTNLAVTPYSGVNNPQNPNGSVITNNIDSRIQKAAEAGGILVASQSVGGSATEDDAQWYAIDVSTGTPTLQQERRVSGGNNTYITYPSIDINAAGQIGMTYMKSGTDSPTDYLSMYVTGRLPSDTAGTMEAPVLVPAGTGQTNYKDFSGGGRAGDLSGINVDPVDGSFWAANEFANTEPIADWGTAVANFTLSNPLPAADVAVAISGPNGASSVTAGTNATYTITVTNNGLSAASGLVLTDLLPAGWTFGSLTQTGGSDGFTQAQSGGTVTETASTSILSTSTDTFSLVLGVPSGVANGASFSDTASVQASNPDPNTANNTQAVTGTVVNNNPTANLSVKVSGPASSSEGSTVTYTITVTNSGPSSAAGVTLTDTLGSLLTYMSASITPGASFTQSRGVVTFNIGSIASGGTVTAKVNAQAIEDGSTSDGASVSASNAATGTASATTSFSEPSINVSGSITTRSTTLTNFQVATFTHASGVEPASSFLATINWGDNTSSQGNISLSGTTYVVTGSHTYSGGGRHTIRTTVIEIGNSPGTESGNKLDTDPATLSPLDRDVVQLSALGNGHGQGNGNGQGNGDGNSQGDSDEVFGVSDQVTVPTLPGQKRSDSVTDALTGHSDS